MVRQVVFVILCLCIWNCDAYISIFNILSSRICSSPPPVPTNGGYKHVRSGYRQVSSVVKYTCNSGYELSGGLGVNVCQNRRWIYSPPRCVVKNNCRSRPCSYNAICTSIFRSYICTCKRGYSGSNPKKRCNKTCRPPYLPSNAIHTPKKSVYDESDRVYFSCPPGWKTVGKSTSALCRYGFFSSSAPSCINPTCQDPVAPANGKSTTRIWWNRGNVVRYSCNDGYKLMGSNNATCMASGDFSKSTPTCLQSTCDPVAPDNGGYSPQPSSAWMGGDVVTYSCNDGYMLMGSNNATCMESGNFSKPTPTCVAYCEAPTVANNVYLLPVNQTTWLSGEVVYYDCFDEVMLVGPYNATCMDNMMFEPPETPVCQMAVAARAAEGIGESPPAEGIGESPPAEGIGESPP